MPVTDEPPIEIDKPLSHKPDNLDTLLDNRVIGLRNLQEQVEDFLEKPFFVKDAAARIKRVVDKISLEKMAREAPGDAVVRGNLMQMNVMDLFQSLEHRITPRAGAPT